MESHQRYSAAAIAKAAPSCEATPHTKKSPNHSGSSTAARRDIARDLRFQSGDAP